MAFDEEIKFVKSKDTKKVGAKKINHVKSEKKLVSDAIAKAIEAGKTIEEALKSANNAVSKRISKPDSKFNKKDDEKSKKFGEKPKFKSKPRQSQVISDIKRKLEILKKAGMLDGSNTEN